MLKQTPATALPHDSLLSRLFPWGSTLKRKRYETQGLNSLDIPLVKPSQQQEAGALLSAPLCHHSADLWRFPVILVVSRAAHQSVRVASIQTDICRGQSRRHDQHL